MEMGQDSKSTQISSLGGREGKKLEYCQGKKSGSSIYFMEN